MLINVISMKNKSPIIGIFWMIITSFFFVGVFVTVKYIGNDVPASQSAFLRYLFGTLILVPIIMPAISSTAILIFLFSWNEYPIALTWISRTDLLTLPVAMARIAGSSIYSIPYGQYAAATVLGSIPLIILVLIFQKQIISGLTQGAVNG